MFKFEGSKHQNLDRLQMFDPQVGDAQGFKDVTHLVRSKRKVPIAKSVDSISTPPTSSATDPGLTLAESML
jgi:hypothetical protein